MSFDKRHSNKNLFLTQGQVFMGTELWKLVCIVLLMTMLLTSHNIAHTTPSCPFSAAATEPTMFVDWNHYHNYSEIVGTLVYLNTTYPNLIQVFSIGKSWQNKDIYAARLTNEDISRQKVQVLFVGYHHARERISAELALYFLVYATTDYGTNQTITRMLDYCEIYVIVSLNADGFDPVEQNEWQRKTVHAIDEDGDGLSDEDLPDDEDGDGYIEDLIQWNGSEWVLVRWEGVDDDADGRLNEDWVGGVDLNRNYGYQWNASCDSGSDDPFDEDYRGTAAFSEPETQAIRDFALQHDFKYAISLHSGAEKILYPWGYTHEVTPHNQIFTEIAASLSTRIGAPYEQAGSWYTTSGVWDDWFYGNRSTFALTCEIYANQNAWRYEPGPYPNQYWESGITQAFNPSPNDIQIVIQRWLPVFTYITSRAITEAYDLTVTNVACNKTTVGQGYSFNMSITVKNQGFFIETSEITIKANATTVFTKTISIGSGESLAITATLNSAVLTKGTYHLNAHVEPVTGETSVEDNLWNDGTIRITLPGDINGDRIVNLPDLVSLAASYGKHPGNPRWNPNADIDNDLAVGLSDLVILADHYGERDS
jgi:hypothetical protein